MTQFKEKAKDKSTKFIENIDTILRDLFEDDLKSVKAADLNPAQQASLNNIEGHLKALRQELTNQTIFDEGSMGLFNYPVLMAADILLYGAKWVPVGEDQRQHLELARDLGLRVNHKFGQELFTVPEPWEKQLAFAQRDKGIRIRSLADPEKKMSKSVSDPRGTIGMLDTPDEAAKKIMSATTDSLGEIQFDFATRPGISNLLQMLALLSGQPLSEVTQQWAGKSNYGELKSAVAEQVRGFLSDFQTKLDAVDEVALMAKLEESEERMREATAPVVYRVQQAVGLRPTA